MVRGGAHVRPVTGLPPRCSHDCGHDLVRGHGRGAAVLLQHAPVFIEYSGVLPATILMLHGVEFMLFASGAAGLVVFILHEIHLFLRGIFRPGGSHDPSYEIKGSCIGPVPATCNVNSKMIVYRKQGEKL